VSRQNRVWAAVILLGPPLGAAVAFPLCGGSLELMPLVVAGMAIMALNNVAVDFLELSPRAKDGATLATFVWSVGALVGYYKAIEFIADWL
jgi:hypothetical protein